MSFKRTHYAEWKRRQRAEWDRRHPDGLSAIGQFAVGLAGDIDKIFWNRKDAFKALIEHRDSLSLEARALLLAALKRAVDIHDKLH